MASCATTSIPSRCASRKSPNGRSKGGITPSGWKCEHLPYLVELDNYGRSKEPGKAGMGVHGVWGWEEITWFSQLPEEARNAWLQYAGKWV